MRAVDDWRPARLLACGVVVAVVAGVGVAGAVLGAPAAPAPAPPTTATEVAPPGAGLSSAFCVAGTGSSATSTVYLTNTATVAVHATMTSTGDASSAPSAGRRSLVVPPLGTVAVQPGSGLAAGSRAASFAFDHGGVAASQAVAGAAGWAMAPCASAVAAQWWFPTGSTANGDSLTLSLFNPTATPAMADVTFATPEGPVAPQPYQGLAVGPGQLVDVDVGAYAQNLPELATEVQVLAGALTSSELEQYASGPPTGLALQVGAPQPAEEWSFPATAAGSGSTVQFAAANPSGSAVTVTFTAGLSGASIVPRTLTVPASSVATFTPSSTPGWPRATPYSLTVRASAPVVVGRTVSGPSGGQEPARGAATGAVAPAARWVVPVPGTAAAPATPGGGGIRSVNVLDPGPLPARVRVLLLGRPGKVLTLVVAPGQPVVLTGGPLPGTAPYLVEASSPVFVEQDDAPSGAPGVVDWPGLPLSG